MGKLSSLEVIAVFFFLSVSGGDSLESKKRKKKRSFGRKERAKSEGREREFHAGEGRLLLWMCVVIVYCMYHALHFFFFFLRGEEEERMMTAFGCF